MPDITLPGTHTGTTDADEVMTDIYSPNTTPASLEVINGWLTEANRDSGVWDIGYQHIRPNSMVKGGMVGATGTLDYFPEFFPASTAELGAYTPVPGAGINFYLPVDPSIVIITWQLSTANNITGANVFEMWYRLGVDGAYNDALEGNRRRVPACRYVGNTRLPRFDRTFWCHWASTTMLAGHHYAQVEVLLTGNKAGMPFLAGAAVSGRVRVRNMTYLAFL